MSDSNLTSERILNLRNKLKLSQQDFASRIGITQGAMSQLESGKSALSLQTITKICSTYDVDCNWLVMGENKPIFAKDDPNDQQASKYPEHIVRDLSGHNLIPLIKEEAHAGYIENCQDLQYLETLDVYRIPGYESGNYRLFEIEGDSMVHTIFPGEIAVTEFVEDSSQIENGSLCIVISKDGIVAKRLYSFEDEVDQFVLKSDNPEYKPFSLKKKDIIEVWTIKGKITSVLVQENTVDEGRLKNLEEDLRFLKEKIQAISKD